MAKKRWLLVMLLVLLAGITFAGNIASFVNLGFSADSRYFMFANYGITTADSQAFCELYIVDVARNAFTKDGVIKPTPFAEDLMPGQDGSGALYTLLTKHAGVITRYGINPLKLGRPVYLLIDGEEPKTDVRFRDFQTGTHYHIHLVQSSVGEGEAVKAAFHILLTVTEATATPRDFLVGLPSYYREGVTGYRIKLAVLSPDEKSVVFVVEKEFPAKTGKTVRYMVETVKIK